MPKKAITSIIDVKAFNKAQNHGFMSKFFNAKKRKQRQRKIKITLALLFGFITAFSAIHVAQNFIANASSSPWTQTDWSGGTASGTITSTVTTYESQTDIDTSTSGQISLGGAAIATFKGTQLSDSSANFNVASKTAIQYNTSQDYNDNVFTYAGGSPTRMTFDEDGDYFISLTFPITSTCTATNNRNAIEADFRINGVKTDIGVARSTYIRNSSGHCESSLHYSGLLQGISASDYLEIYVARTTTQTTNLLTTTGFTLFAEQIASDETIFYANGTETDASTDLNSSESAMKWSEIIEDSGFTHSAGSSTVTIDSAGDYFVAVNIPIGSSTQRANITGRVELDGSLVDGGIFQQGYIRNADSHSDGSIHWAGVVTTTGASQDLQITVQQEAAGGTVTTDSEKATLYIQELPSNSVISLEGTQVDDGNNWNTGGNVNWTTQNIIDTDVYTHSTSTNNDRIYVDEDGDYLVMFNFAGTGSVTRANPKVELAVNGATVTGAEAKSGYIRNSSNHNSSSNNLLVPLLSLSNGDYVTAVMSQEAASGTINDDTPGIITLVKKGYASSGTLTSNIFNVEYGADWGVLDYTTSGTGTTNIKVRTDNNSDMSGATAFGSCTAIADEADMSSNGCVTDGHQYIQYQVTLEPSGGSTPVLEDISLAFAATDSVAPTTNATSIAITDVDDAAWTNTEPTITWTAGADDGAGEGLYGYCLALDEVDVGASDTLDPVSSGGVLGAIDDGITKAHIDCPYITTATSINLNSLSGLTLTTNKQYYFSIKAVDLAGNTYAGASGNWQDLVSFKYDNTAPTNVAFISTPSSNFGSVDDMFFTWPITGGSRATDTASGIIGWQYSLNGTSDYKGPDTESDLGITYIEDDSSTSEHYFTTATDGSDISVGNNTIYFRAVDAAGNFSTAVTGGISYGGAAPTFGGGEVVTITPSTNTSNSFALSWNAATANEGTIDSYYYMVNNTPPNTLDTLTSNSTLYIPVTSTSVATKALTNAVKGSNTVYVVAVDTEDNYSPSNYVSGTFTLNSTLPDGVQNLSASDTSIKSEEIWRATVAWQAPEYKGTGSLTYVVERSTDNSTWTQVTTTTGTSHTDTVTDSTTYYYRVGAYDTSDASIAAPTYASSVSVLPKGTFDTAPTLSSDPVVTNITTQKATVSWSTSRNGDTKVSYGTSSGDYFDEEPSKSEQVTAHEIQLINLDPGTKYYYVAKWTDEDGNTGTSDELTFTTDPRPETKEISVNNISITSAIVEFTTTNAVKARVYYGETTTFGGVAEITTGTSESTHTVQLTGLSDGTEYFYKIATFDSEDEEYEGDTNSFETLPRPQISDVRVQQIKGTAQPSMLITWTTNTEVSSIVTYYPSDNPGGARDEVNVTLISGQHRMAIVGLLPQTRYSLIVSGRDIVGNEATSDVQSFTTATDTRPPLISNLKIEGSNVPIGDGSGQQQSQLVISWDTDEPATSQVQYGEGTGSTYAQSTQEDSNLKFNHIVIISGLSPSKVYHLRAVAKDDAGNVTESVDNVTITPKATDNALDLVVGSLREAFGFLDGVR